jgi:ABC-type uncharacterized transport system involved in gliding motility auxiliary subunit
MAGEARGTGGLKLLSLGGVVALAAVLIAINYLVGRVPARVDLTEGNVYTLSDGTRNILGKLEAPVKVRLYASQGEQVPVQLRAFARRVDDLLGEYQQAAKGRIVLERLDPQPDSDAEDAARLDGIQAQQLPTGESIYLGIAVSQLDQKVAIPFVSPDRERLLEYDISRAITSATTTKKPVIGVMSAMPIWGARNPMNPMQQSEAWHFADELARDYEVKRVALDVEAIDDEVKVLLVIHPQGLSEGAAYAIDQFVLRGGKLIAFLDGLAYFDQRGPMMGMPGSGSTLEPLLKTWGITFEPGKVVADPSIMFGRGMQATTTLLSIAGDLVNRDDVAANPVQSLLLAFPGAFGGAPAQGLTQTVLFRSSPNAGLIDAANATTPGMAALKDFKPAGEPYPLAIRLSGRFKTAFAAGKPLPKSGDKKDGDAGQGAAAKSNAGATAAPGEQGKGSADKPAGASVAASPLKESTGDNSVVLVADADFIANDVALQVAEVFGQRVYIPRNDNLSFALSLVEQMAGDSNLTTLRSRAGFSRPFTRVNAMEAQAAAGYRGKLQELEDSLTQTRSKLAELQKQAPAQKSVITPEQQAEIDQFRTRESEIRRDLKELRKSLRHDIDSLEFWTKIANIALMPALVALVGLVLAGVRRRRATLAT